MNNRHIMLLRLYCRKADKAFAPLVSFIFIVIAFPYKHIRKKEKKITSMRYRLRDSSNEKLHGVNVILDCTLLHIAFCPFRIFSSLKRLFPIHLSPIQIQCFCISRITHKSELWQGRHRLVRRAQVRL